MKKLSTISIFIFAVVVIAILVAGLLFYQNKKDNQATNKIQNTNNVVDTQTTTKNTTPTKNTTTTKTTNQNANTTNTTKVLNMAEVSKHNSQSDCWLVISGKVYDITSYFGRHPGGNGTMLATCGTDATAAYNTKDPNATSSNYFSNGHSSRAESMLANYFVGNLQ